MSVKNIYYLAGSKMGLDPSQSNQRATLERLLNEAAEELYDQADLQGSLWEQTMRINGDQTVTMPAYVHQVRAIRESASQRPWHINRMQPRYFEFNWKDCWRNVRLRNKQCLMSTVTNTSLGVLIVPIVENPPIVVTVSGPTQNATCISEDITMSSLTMMTQNAYTDYVSVRKNIINTCDVTLTDVDGKILTVIPNNQLEAIYQILDISLCPWLPISSGPFDNYVEVIYKKRLPYLSEDDQEFPCVGYDYIIVNKILQLWGEEQGKADMALSFDSKATRSAGRKQEDQNKEAEDVVSLTSNAHDTLLRRVGVGMRKRFSFYAGRRW